MKLTRTRKAIDIGLANFCHVSRDCSQTAGHNANVCCLAAYPAHELHRRFEFTMPKKHQQHKTKKANFPCQSAPAHNKCKKEKYTRTILDQRGNEVGEVRWAPCQKGEAIKYMRDEYGEDSNAESHHHHQSRRKGQSKKHHTPSGPGFNQQQHKHGHVAGGQQNTPAQAPAYHQYQHRRVQPATASPADGAVLKGLLRRQSTPDLEESADLVRTWMAGHGAPETGIPSNQGAVFPDGAVSGLGVGLDQGMVSAPVMPSPQATPHGQQQRHRHRHHSHRPSRARSHTQPCRRRGHRHRP